MPMHPDMISCACSGLLLTEFPFLVLGMMHLIGILKTVTLSFLFIVTFHCVNELKPH